MITQCCIKLGEKHELTITFLTQVKHALMIVTDLQTEVINPVTDATFIWCVWVVTQLGIDAMKMKSGIKENVKKTTELAQLEMVSTFSLLMADSGSLRRKRQLERHIPENISYQSYSNRGLTFVLLLKIMYGFSRILKTYTKAM